MLQNVQLFVKCDFKLYQSQSLYMPTLKLIFLITLFKYTMKIPRHKLFEYIYPLNISPSFSALQSMVFTFFLLKRFTNIYNIYNNIFVLLNYLIFGYIKAQQIDILIINFNINNIKSVEFSNDFPSCGLYILIVYIKPTHIIK